MMINDMISVMKRITDLKKRFGLIKSNITVNDNRPAKKFAEEIKNNIIDAKILEKINNINNNETKNENTNILKIQNMDLINSLYNNLNKDSYNADSNIENGHLSNIQKFIDLYKKNSK